MMDERILTFEEKMEKLEDDYRGRPKTAEEKKRDEKFNKYWEEVEKLYDEESQKKFDEKKRIWDIEDKRTMKRFALIGIVLIGFCLLGYFISK